MLLADQGSLGQYDAIVIGSGISGLTMALILARQGRQVALFERDCDIAPLIRPYKRNGCECSPGLHTIGWLGDGEIIDRLLNYLEVADGIEKTLDEKGFGNILIGADSYHIPKGFANVEKSLLAYFPESAAAVHHYLKLLQEVNEQTFNFKRQSASGSNSNYYFGELDHVTLEECLRQYKAQPQLIKLLGTFNYILMGSKADEVPFRVHAFVVGGYLSSPGFFALKGIKRLIANYKRELSRFGVALWTNSEVAEILVGNNRNAIGIKMQNGSCYYASQVITSFNPKLLNKMVSQTAFRPIYRKRLVEAEITFGLYVAFYKIENYQEYAIENFIYDDDKLGVTLGATINHCGTDGVLSVFLVDNEPMLPADSEIRKERAKEKLRLLEKVIYAKNANLRGKLVLMDYLKPWSFERYTKTINGSAYSIKQTVNLLGFQTRTPLRGLYLIGQSIYPGFLGSMLSSFVLAPELLEIDDFWARVINQ